MTALPNRLQRVRETTSERWTFRYANGLVVQTDPFMRADRSRVLPIGGPQDVILNRLVCHPELVAGKRVFDPFAGSGVLGLMALKLGAAHVDFLDISKRAQEFQLSNARINGVPAERFRALLGSIADFEPAEPYELVLCNPPFIPTPEGLTGTQTSSGGPLGNTYVEQLLAKLDRALLPQGEAFLYLMQLVAGERPSICEAALRDLPGRTLELTPIQQELMPLPTYVAAYLRSFPAQHVEIRRWERQLHEQFRESLALQHYVLHAQPQRPGPASYHISDNLAEKFGGGMAYPANANADLALARVMENLVPIVN